jgi:hypothetical protein
MKIISHRGNINGPSKDENKPSQIAKALLAGFDCEVDVWVKNGEILLGHDKPQFLINREFLNKPGLWIHAKNLKALEFLNQTNLNYFWHEDDAFTITSHRYIWCFPGYYTKLGITVMQGDAVLLPEPVYGVCTDYPSLFKKDI